VPEKFNGRTTDRFPVSKGCVLSIEVLLDDGRLVMVSANRVQYVTDCV
jgi:hypothetical protein